jgi:hypothetical protein
VDALERATWPQPRLRPSAAARELGSTGCSRPMVPGCAEDRPDTRHRASKQASLRSLQCTRSSRRLEDERCPKMLRSASHFGSATRRLRRSRWRAILDPSRPAPIDPLHLRHEYGSCPMMFHDHRRTARRAAGDQGRARKALAQAAAMEGASIEKALKRLQLNGSAAAQKSGAASGARGPVSLPSGQEASRSSRCCTASMIQSLKLSRRCTAATRTRV